MPEIRRCTPYGYLTTRPRVAQLGFILARIFYTTINGQLIKKSCVQLRPSAADGEIERLS